MCTCASAHVVPVRSDTRPGGAHIAEQLCAHVRFHDALKALQEVLRGHARQSEVERAEEQLLGIQHLRRGASADSSQSPAAARARALRTSSRVYVLSEM